MPITEQRIGGVCAATLTPVDEGFAPDHPALVAHCRRLLANGCDAINLLGTTGEATSLSVAARIGVMEAIAGAGLPMHRFMVGTGAAALGDARTLTRAAVELGFGGSLVMPPFYFKDLIDDGVVAYYDALVAGVGAAGLRLYLYNFPQLTGFTFSIGLVQRLQTVLGDSLIGIKDSSGVPGYAAELAAACPRLDVFPSNENTLAAGRANGLAGCISATVNVSAPVAGRVWGGEGDAEDADLGAIRSAIAQHQLVPAIRAVLADLVADAAWTRVVPPLVALAPRAAADLIARLDAIPAFATIREAYTCA